VAGDLGDPHSLVAHLSRYLEAMRSLHYAESTLENRQAHLEQLITWLADRSIGRSADVTREILERYRRWLYYYRKQDGQPLHPHTQGYKLVSVRAFFKWLSKQRLILYNPASELEVPRQRPRLPVTLTAAEAERVLEQPNIETMFGLRNRTILETLYSTGIRAAELTRLGTYDLDSASGTLMIRQGKGKKDRLVPIGERALGWIQRYLDNVRPALLRQASLDTLFLGRTGNPMSRDHLSTVVRNYVLAAELGKRGSCHLFRHTLATLMLEGGADIRYIQAMLGHAKLTTTQVYTKVSIQKLKEVHTKTHPAAKPKPSSNTVDDGNDRQGSKDT